MVESIVDKIRKLRSMPGHEIRFRIRSVMFKWFEYIRYRLKMNSSADDQFCKELRRIKTRNNCYEELKQLFETVKRDRFFLESFDKKSRFEIIKTNLDYSSWISQAEKILSGKMNLLGCELKIPFSGGWHIDPLELKEWPRLFYAHLKNSKQFKKWDIKYVWEVNRHQYLIVLGKAFWLTGDERYAEKVVSVINSWIDENPYNIGVNWTSSLEHAVRTISWLWAFFFCMGSKFLTKKFQEKFFKSIYEQANYIEQHLSYYSSPYNHLIGEAAALHLIGNLLPMFNSGKRWEQLGWSILVERVDDQFHEDGMSVEQASFYHHFTLGFYLQSMFLRRNNKKSIPSNVLVRIEKALDFSLHLTKPDGTLPMIGDIDNARSLYFMPSHHWGFSGFLSLGAILFKRKDFKYLSSGLCEELIWLANEEDLSLFLNLESGEPKKTSAAFYRSGYFITRDSWQKDSNYLCFDCGELAAGLSEGAVPSAAHGHADALSFDLVVQGKSFIVDGGFYTYFGDLSWHKHFRHEEAHNALIIGKNRQAEYCGRLTWQNVRKPCLHRWETTKNYDAVTGSVKYDKDTLHIRQMLTIKKQLWLLQDFVETSHSMESVQSFLNFSHEVELEHNKETGELVATIGEVGLLIKYLGMADVSINRGGKNPESGWVAHGYGIKYPAWRALFKWKTVDCKNSLAMLMIPFNVRKDSLVVKYNRFTEDGVISKINLTVNNKHYSIKMDKKNHTHFNYEDVDFDVSIPKRG